MLAGVKTGGDESVATAVDAGGPNRPDSGPIGNASETMAEPKPADLKPPAPRLYLVTPVIEDGAAFRGQAPGRRRSSRRRGGAARLKDAGERDLINRVKLLAPIVQGKEVALVLDGHPDIAAKASADGAHLTGVEVFGAAVEGRSPRGLPAVAG